MGTHKLARVKWEHERWEELGSSRLPAECVIRGQRVLIKAFIPSVQYADPVLIDYQRSGNFLSLLRLAAHDLLDSDVKLVPADDPVKIAIGIQISDNGVEPPIVELVSPVCHPHVLGRQMCYGKLWRKDKSSASILPGILNMLTFQPGSYQLVSDPLNLSASRWLERQSKIKLPLTSEKYK